MSIEDIIRRLREDRQIAERDRLQARIAAAFDLARKRAPAAELLKTKIEYDAVPEVEVVMETPKKQVPLAQQAEPLLSSIGSVPVFRKKDVKCYEIKEVFQGDVMELFAEAEAALGFKKPEPKIDMLKCNIKTERLSIWKRDILGMARKGNP